jgi:D-alanyl-lipoteichoic acid acyltransferase DltB (MBOAT superfamily)
MAIGFGRLIGFNVTKNFDFPFFAQNIAEFWRKWHISLTSWLTEYVFTPLSISFRDLGKTGLILAIVINFAIIGMWHGANWTFVLFGILHGCYYIPLILKGTMNKKRKIAQNKLPSFPVLTNILGTFTLVMLTNIVFRSETIGQAWGYFSAIFSKSLFSFPATDLKAIGSIAETVFLMGLIVSTIIFGWLQRNKQHVLQFTDVKISRTFRWGIYYIIVFSIILFYKGGQQDFIYFQF